MVKSNFVRGLHFDNHETHQTKINNSPSVKYEDMAVSSSRGAPIYTPTHYNPSYWDPSKGTLIFGNFYIDPRHSPGQRVALAAFFLVSQQKNPKPPEAVNEL